MSYADVDIRVEKRGVRVTASTATTAQTGVEMEASTAAAVAALTVYDMVKAVDKAAVITDVRVEEKTGGKSGTVPARLAMTACRRLWSWRRTAPRPGCTTTRPVR